MVPKKKNELTREDKQKASNNVLKISHIDKNVVEDIIKYLNTSLSTLIRNLEKKAHCR